MDNNTLIAVIFINGLGALIAGCIAYAKTNQTGAFIGFFIFGLILWPLAIIIACFLKAPVGPPQPPGWYSDPWQPASIRYYDGHQWTYHTQAQQAA